MIAPPAVDATFELVAGALTFPTSVAFAADGAPLVAESGVGFGGAPPGGRVLRLGRAPQVLVEGLHAPVNGLTVHDGDLLVSEAAAITRIDAAGQREPVLSDLPGPGNYHTNMTAVGPDGRLYFSQGALTNTGIVGLDAYEIGWLRRLPHAHDLPGHDLVLTGVNARTPDQVDSVATVDTGAFRPFGTRSYPGERISARLPCTAAVMSCALDGSDLRLVAWGLRNAYGIAFLPDGRLLVTDQGADDRGSRPLGQAPDLLYDIRPGRWYGWPDFVGGVPATDGRFQPERGGPPRFLIANHDELPGPERPLLAFPPHAAAVKLAALPADHPVWPGQIVVALFGDERPMTAPGGPRAGRALARIDPADWSLHLIARAPLKRPIDVAVAPDGDVFVLDFGDFEMGAAGRVCAVPGSGALWRLSAAGS